MLITGTGIYVCMNDYMEHCFIVIVSDLNSLPYPLDVILDVTNF